MTIKIIFTQETSSALEMPNYICSTGPTARYKIMTWEAVEVKEKNERAPCEMKDGTENCKVESLWLHPK